jgi:hypothetical protein
MLIIDYIHNISGYCTTGGLLRSNDSCPIFDDGYSDMGRLFCQCWRPSWPLHRSQHCHPGRVDVALYETGLEGERNYDGEERSEFRIKLCQFSMAGLDNE